MHTLRVGERLPPFSLPSIEGITWGPHNLAGKRALISFMRFAACPFCNLRVHLLVQQSARFGSDFTTVVIFDSPLDHLGRHAKRHHAPFPVLADEAGAVHRAYGIRYSWAGVARGMLTRIPTLLKAMVRHGFLPTSLRGSLTTMPADFLVDERGRIHTAYYGTDEGDHLPLEAILAFATGQGPGMAAEPSSEADSERP